MIIHEVWWTKFWQRLWFSSYNMLRTYSQIFVHANCVQSFCNPIPNLFRGKINFTEAKCDICFYSRHHYLHNVEHLFRYNRSKPGRVIPFPQQENLLAFLHDQVSFPPSIDINSLFKDISLCKEADSVKIVWALAQANTSISCPFLLTIKYYVKLCTYLFLIYIFLWFLTYTIYILVYFLTLPAGWQEISHKNKWLIF